MASRSRPVVSAAGPVSGYAIAEGRHLVQDHDDPARFGNHSCAPTTQLVDDVTLVGRTSTRPENQHGRKRILAPDWSELTTPTKPQPDGMLVKALPPA